MERPSIVEQDWRWTPPASLEQGYQLLPKKPSYELRFSDQIESSNKIQLEFQKDQLICHQKSKHIDIKAQTEERGPLLSDCPQSQKWCRLQNRQPGFEIHLSGSCEVELLGFFDHAYAHQFQWNLAPNSQVTLKLKDHSPVPFAHVSHFFHLQSSSQLRLWQLSQSVPKKALLELKITLEENARCHHFGFFQIQNATWRQSLHYELLGRGSQVKSHFASYAEKGQCDLQVTQSHRAPSTQAQCQLHSVGEQNSRTLFHGLIRVDRVASQTESHQSHKSLLNARSAQIISTPRLEVLPSQVDCSHGSATDVIDEESLLFLQMRGWSLSDAQNFLKNVFLREAFPPFEQEEEIWFEKEIKFLTSKNP
jgi:hypothetical protein